MNFQDLINIGTDELTSGAFIAISILHGEQGCQAMRDASGREILYLPHLNCFLVAEGDGYNRVAVDMNV